MAEQNVTTRSGAAGRVRPSGKGTGKVTTGHRAASGGRPSGGQAGGKKPSAKKSADGKTTGVGNRDAGGGSGNGTSKRRSETVAGAVLVRDRRRLSEKMGRSTRLKLWLQSSALDFLLVLVVCVSLSYSVSYGFYSAEAHRGNVLLLGGMAVPLLLALFAGSWSKRMVPVSAAAAVLISGAYIAIATALSPDPSFFAGGHVNDVADNYTTFAVVVCATTVLSYLLSRRTAGLVFLLVFGVVACGLVQFQWSEWITDLSGMTAFFAMFLGVGMLFVYQCYKQSVYSANRVKRTSFTGAFAYSAIICILCVAAGAGLFAGISSIAPDTQEFKPFTSNVSPPVDENSNSYQRTSKESDEMSNQTNDDQQKTHDTAEGGRDSGAGGFGLFAGSFIQSAASAMAGFDPDDPDQNVDNIAYLILTWELIIVGVLLALLVLAIVLLWRYRRTWRLKRIARESGGYQAWYLYTFLVERFRRLRLAKPVHLTPLEFAVGFSKPMLPFTRGTGGVDFVDVSSTYQNAAFGSEAPTDEELEQLRRYYKAFFKNARQYVGFPKWVLWKFWRV